MGNLVSTQPLDKDRSEADQQEIDAAKHAHLKTDLGRIAKAMYTQNLTLGEKVRTLSILRSIDTLILQSNRDLNQLSADISKTIIESSQFSLVGVLSLNYFNDQYLNYQGWSLNPIMASKILRSGILPLLLGLKLPLESKWLSSKSNQLIIDFENPEAFLKVENPDNELSRIFDILHKVFGLRSLYMTKLKARGRLTGLMVVGLEDSIPHLDDIELIMRLSEPTGIALYNRLLFEENQTVLRQLQQTNDKLKEIDEAKDEFISMASHQLRTPLTSMKGYVSMVLEGDTGPITDPQRSMLQQAFNSSQRMVYLIADLLNVSRLRTGKFVITNKVTDLPNVIESELGQLQETALSRGIKFFFNKPQSFPKVMLDETKIRQVVMNFLDNALFYTPHGGRVTVELLANNTIIEYLVTDNGLGVPKSEQHNLFTKFYRAQNARKMRPDGTGLGLYMARKVIVAQGGTIIFHSNEGEGSTFGFKFPRDKIELKTPLSS